MTSPFPLPPGWLFNNCYQLDDTTWRINLRRPDNLGAWYTDWATGATFSEAVEDCISNLLDAEFHTDAPISSSIDRSTAPTRPAFLTKLLSATSKPARPIIPRRGL